MACEAFPELWFELPLLGDPWFDLHMLVKCKDVKPEATYAGHGGVYTEVLQWFASQSYDDVRQLALSYDVGNGSVDWLAIQLLLRRESAVAEDFLLFCFPAFLKLKWCNGEPVDAKAYLMAGVQ